MASLRLVLAIGAALALIPMLLLCGFDDDVCIEKRQHNISKKDLNRVNIDCEGVRNPISSSGVSSCFSANVAHVDQFQSNQQLSVRESLHEGHKSGVSETIDDVQFSSPFEDERVMKESLSCEASSDISSLGRTSLNAHVNCLIELTVTNVSVASTNISDAGSIRDSPSNSTEMLLVNLTWPWSWFARCWNGVVKISWIPYVIVITDMMRGFAAGLIL